MNRILLLLGFLCFNFTGSAQVRLVNASFEGEPQDATTPISWFTCEMGSSPDILPGPFGVLTEASEGETFIGLIARKDGSFEDIGQRLAKPLHKSECYSLNIELAHSPSYTLSSNPIQLRIWGSETRCSKDQLLIETEVIDHEDWEHYEFKFTTKVDINYIILEAHLELEEGETAKQGNILIDNISEIKLCRRASL